MPRSFTCWNDRRRPDPRLFSVPGGTPDATDDESASSPAAVDEIEQLLAGLLEDGVPVSPPNDDLGVAAAAPQTHPTMPAKAPMQPGQEPGMQGFVGRWLGTMSAATERLGLH